MTQQISVLVKTTGVLDIVAGSVADPAGNLWNLPNPTHVPSGGQVTVTAVADAGNANAPWPGSAIPLTIENPQAGWISAATAGQVTPVEFITNFSEFGNAANYPVSQIQFWLNTAYKRLPARPWGDLLDLGAQLYVAHNLALEFQNGKQAGNGIQPGQQTGPLNSKSVDKVAMGYDTGAGSIDGGGNYNLTNYGTRFLELVDIVGVLGTAIIGLPQVGFVGQVIAY